MCLLVLFPSVNFLSTPHNFFMNKNVVKEFTSDQSMDGRRPINNTKNRYRYVTDSDVSETETDDNTSNDNEYMHS